MRRCCWGILALLLAVPAAWSAPRAWVDGRWDGPANCGGHQWQVDAFPTVQGALDKVAAGTTIEVAPGRYVERIAIMKSVTLRGPGAGVNPNAPTAQDPFAANPARGNPAKEAVILPPDTKTSITGGGLLITIQADKVTIDGLTLDGDNPALADGVAVNGVDANAAGGIGHKAGHDTDIILVNNILRNFTSSAIYFQNKDRAIPISQRNIIAYNRIDNVPLNATLTAQNEYPPSQCAGIFLEQELYQVLGNTVTRAAIGINLRYMTLGNAPLLAPEVSGNAVLADVVGICCGLFNDRNLKAGTSPTPPRALVSHNTVRIGNGPAQTIRVGINLTSIEHNSKVIASDNDVAGGDAGYFVWGSMSFDAANAVIRGGTVRDARYGVWISNYYEDLPYPVDPTRAIISGVTILNPGVAGIFVDDGAKGTSEVSAAIMHGTTVRGGPTGLLILGERALVTFLAGAAGFEGQEKRYIVLQGNGGTFPRSVDISAVRFGGKQRAEMSAAEQAALETRLVDQLDDERLGRLQ